MDLKEFRSGKYVQQNRYKSFSPAPVNHVWVWTHPRVNTLLEQANHALGSLNALSMRLPDVDYYIRMHVIKEATTSSRIEGTRTNIEEALQTAREIDPEKRDDWQDVQNYIRAMNHAVERLDKIPVSTRLLRETHKILLQKGRGQYKAPGEYRKTQNWIGGSTISDATFVPPSPEEVDSLMSDLEKFLHNDTIEVPNLVRIAIAHYQFETIHPFLDGNGRIGRLLIPLYLVSRGLLEKPTLYVSDYFDKHRDVYYDTLMAARTRNDLEQWIMLFLVAIGETSNKGVQTLTKIQELRDDVEGKRIAKLGKKLPRAKKLVLSLYKNPRVNVADAVKVLGVSPKSAYDLVADLVRLNILVEVTGRQRDRVFLYREYVDLFTN